MLDFLLLVTILGSAVLALKSPWMGVLLLAYAEYMHPQGYADDWMRNFPVYKLFFFATLTGFVWSREWYSKEWFQAQFSWLLDWRILLIAAFWLQTTLSGLLADQHEYLWAKWLLFSVMLLSLMLTPLLIDTRKKFNALMLVIALSISLVAFKGGFWALLYAAKARVYGPPDSQFYDNNLFAIVTLMALPLLFAGFQLYKDRFPRILFSILAFTSVVSVLSSWSRGAILSLVAVCFFLLWQHKRRIMSFSVLMVISIFSFFLMPQGWQERMLSMLNFTGSGMLHDSRMTGLLVGYDAGMQNIFSGWGFESWRLQNVSFSWHNSYLESFVDHGLPGFLLWLVLMTGTFYRLGAIRVKNKSNYFVCTVSIAFQASLIVYAVSSLFFGITYWMLFYQLVVLSMVFENIIKNIEPESGFINPVNPVMQDKALN